MDSESDTPGYVRYGAEGKISGGTFETLAQEVDRLTDVMDRLESRLTPVLHPPMPSPGNTGVDSDRAVVSPVSDLRDKLASRISRLKELSERIDL